jgi:hypothetical protein
MIPLPPASLTEPDPAVQQAAEPWRLPRRDYILLPLIFAATIAVLLGGGEIAARLLYPRTTGRRPAST